MEFLGSIFGIGKDIWETTGNWFGYINSLDANMQNLKRKIGELSTQEDDINTQLTSAEQQPRKRRKVEVDNWLHDVQTIKGDVQTLQRKQQEVVGWKCVFSRAQLGKQVAEKIQEVEKLREKGTFSNGLMIDTLPNSGGFIPTASLGETTSERNKENVWNCLMDDEVRRIGVYGMGGVGKTTIMHHINNKLLKEKTHDGVFWVTVSKAFNLRNLQRRIAEALGLDLSNYGDETRRASELHAMFSRKKRYVLILDDLWEAFDLKKVGIPEPDRDNGCKLVLTTRSLKVCGEMKCIEIKVELLTKEEALNLFMTTVEEDQTKLDREVKEIATKVAKECARLPLAIITVAGSMRGSRVSDIHEWKNALNELISATKQIRGTISDPVFERLKFSYSRLKDEKLQHCFLYCALYPEDHIIPREELIEHWIAEELITEMNSRGKMFAKGHTILNKLIDTCLLESVTMHCGECVRMHDLIRDMALKITSTSPRFMVRAGEGLERVPYEDWSEDLERVSLMSTGINKFPSGPLNCPQLTTLLLGQRTPPIFYIPTVLNVDASLLRIPDSFFMNMPRLKVLVLSNNHNMQYVPSLEKLKALRELKLENNPQLEEVPQGIEELVNLRNLDLSRNYSLHTFPGWKLCKLTQLQCLRIDLTRVTVSARELLCLTQLEEVGAHFQNVQELTSYVTSQQCQRLKNYRFLGNDFQAIGTDYYFPERSKFITENKVYVCFNPAHSGNRVDLLVLPNNIKSFVIRNCHDSFSLSDILSLRDAKDLRFCTIKDCNGIESIISTSSSSFSEDCQIPLRTVEILYLFGLRNFRVLFDGVVPPHNISFKLKTLSFDGCERIKNIFPVNLLQNFPNLEALNVQDCENLEDIIVDEEMNDRGGHRQDDRNTIIILRNLKYLRVKKLPRLKSICKSIMVCESITSIGVFECPMLRRLPLSLHKDGEQWSAPPTRVIRGSKDWWESLIWDDPQTKATLQPFFYRSPPEPYEESDEEESDEEE